MRPMPSPPSAEEMAQDPICDTLIEKLKTNK